MKISHNLHARSVSYVAAIILILTGGVLKNHAEVALAPDIVWRTNLYSLGARVTSLAFSTDGAMLASCMDRTTSVWQVSEKALSRSFSSRGESLCTVFSKDGSLLATGDSYGNVNIWRVADGFAVLPAGASEGDNSNFAVTFSPDRRMLMRAALESGLRYIYLLDAPPITTAPPFNYPEEVAAYDVQFSPDGRWVAAGLSDNTAKLYRISDGALHRELSGHAGIVTSVDFSPNGLMLVTAATDGDARLWRTLDGQLIRTIRGGGGKTVDIFMGRTRFSADGASLISLSNGVVRFWSVADGRLLSTYPELGAFSIAVSPDGKYFAYGTGGVYATNATVVLARWPLLVTGAGVRTNAMHLEWQGGTGLYQVEQRTNLSSGVWEAIAGPLTNTKLQVPATNRATFFRIQSLTNAP